MALSHSAQVIKASSWIPSSRAINLNLGANIIVSDQHHPFCTPTKHNLVTQNPKAETFPKSTYASGDDGIPTESQKEITKSGFYPGLKEGNSEKIKKDLAINVLFKSRHPVNLKLFGLNPAKSHEFRVFRLGVKV